MSNKTFNAKNNRAKKGISPVIATVILVAVAVVIAAALAGFSGSLFSSYSQGPQVKVVSMTLHATGVVDLVMANSGSASDAVTGIAVNGFGNAGALNVALAANTNPINLPAVGTITGTPAEGQQVTAVITMASGSTITQTVNVVA